jgi:hypothetical protein
MGHKPIDPDPFSNHIHNNRSDPIPLGVRGINGAGEGGVCEATKRNRNCSPPDVGPTRGGQNRA